MSNHGKLILLILAALLPGPARAVSLAPSPPDPPTLLTVTAVEDMAFLTWTSSPGAGTYSVKRSATPGGPYTRVQREIEFTAYTDTYLIRNKPVYYVVSATNVAGEGLDSAEVSAVPLPATQTPLAPSGVTAVGGDTSVFLTWEAAAGATSYTVRSSTTSGGPYTPITSNYSYWQTTVAPATGLANGTTYYFVVSATNAFGTSPDSAEIPATTALISSGPGMPGNFSAVAGNHRVTLTWTPAAGATNYYCYRGTGPSDPLVSVKWGPASITYCTDWAPTDGIAYSYYLQAYNSWGYGPLAGPIVVTVRSVELQPQVPTGLSAVAGERQVHLSWNDMPSAVSYNVYRATDPGGGYTRIDTLPSHAPPLYHDYGLTNYVTYYYGITCVPAYGWEGTSAAAVATPASGIAPSVPYGLTAQADDGQMTLYWAPSPEATGYKVKRSMTTGGPYLLLGQTSERQYPDTGLTNGVTYYYVVSALNADGESANSSEFPAVPNPRPPAPPVPPPGSGGGSLDFSGLNMGGGFGCGMTGGEAILVLLLLRGMRRKGRKSP